MMQSLHDKHPFKATLDFGGLRIFIALAEIGHFTKTAHFLGVPQSTVSRSIQRLESVLGVTLASRTKRGIVLTEAGERFLQRAKQILTTLDVARSEMSSIREEPRGNLVVGVIPSVGSFVVPVLLAEFRASYPSVRVILHESTSLNLASLVSQSQIELAVIVAPVANEGLKQLRLWQEDYVLMVSKGHRFESRSRPILWAEIIEEPIIMQPSTSVVSALEEASVHQGTRPDIFLVTDNLETLNRMVSAKLGVGIVPRTVVQEVPGSHPRFLDIAGSPIRSVVLVHRGEDFMSPAGRAMRRLFKNYANSRDS